MHSGSYTPENREVRPQGPHGERARSLGDGRGDALVRDEPQDRGMQF